MKIAIVVMVIVLFAGFANAQNYTKYQESYEQCKKRVQKNIKIQEDAGYVFTKKQKKCKVKYQCTGIPCRPENRD